MNLPSDGKPKGGRGMKADYPTKVMRVPCAIEQDVEYLTNTLRLNGTTDLTILLELIRKYKAESSHTRDWTQFDKFMDEVSGSTALGL